MVSLTTAIADLTEIKALRLEVSACTLRGRELTVSPRPRLGSDVSVKRPAFHMEAVHQPPAKVSPTIAVVQQASGRLPQLVRRLSALHLKVPEVVR